MRIIDRLSVSASCVRVIPSRCTRMRFRQGLCEACGAACPRGALVPEAGSVTIRGEKCSSCMLCAAACPAGAIEIEGFDFGALLGSLRGIENPVVACARATARAHERVECLGGLAGEHLIAFLVFLTGTVQLSVAACAGCENGPAVTAALAGRTDAVARATGLNAGARLPLVANPEALRYRDRSADRRGFLASLRRLPVAETLSAMSAVREPHAPAPALSYASKALPERREVLNRIIETLGKEPALAPLARSIVRAYYFEIAVGPSCTLCFACMGACPTGAIEIDRERPERGIAFHTARCTGCGLCISFCQARSIELRANASGESGPVTAGGAAL